MTKVVLITQQQVSLKKLLDINYTPEGGFLLQTGKDNTADILYAIDSGVPAHYLTAGSSSVIEGSHNLILKSASAATQSLIVSVLDK